MADGETEGSTFSLAVMSAESGQAIQLSGRAARIVALVAVYQQQINAMGVGMFEVQFAGKKLRPRLTQSLDVSLDDLGLSG